MAQIVATGFSVDYSEKGGGADLSLSSFIDSPPAKKQAMAMVSVVHTMHHDYDDVKLGDITGMLESEINEVAPNSDDESSSHRAICEALLCVEEDGIEKLFTSSLFTSWTIITRITDTSH